jgi:hypothetical protein
MDTTESALVEIPIPQSFLAGRIVFTQGGKGAVGKTAFTGLLVGVVCPPGSPIHTAGLGYRE